MKRIVSDIYEQGWGLFAPEAAVAIAPVATVVGVTRTIPAGPGGPAAQRRGDPPPQGASPRLDLLRNNVTRRKAKRHKAKGLKATGRVLVKPHSCRCRTCPSCGPRYGRKVRARLLERGDQFEHPAMLTLTVDPDRFEEDPAKAFATITKGRYIARLMKHLGVTRWVWVLEFTQAGWPHWHLLIDKPGGFVDLKKAWEWWGWNRDGWKLGGIDLGTHDSKDGRHAVLYITKYLIKYPDQGFPDWVRDFDRRIRWVQASRLVGRIVSDREQTTGDVQEQDNAEEAAESLPEHHRTLRQREANCGTAVEFLRECVDPVTGQVSLVFAGRLELEIVRHALAHGQIVIDRDDDGRTFMPDPGDLRRVMAEWIGQALRAGVTVPTLRERQKPRHRIVH